jgi:hypothetical protein
MVCSACSKNRNELTPRKSRLMTGMTLLLCNSCLEKKFEPRYVIVLFGRANGFESVSDYVKSHRYSGSDILASEFV